MLRAHAITGGFYGCQFVLSLAAAALLARLIGPEGRGVVAASMVLPQTLLGIVSVWVAGGVSYHTAKAPWDAGKILGTALACGLVVCCALLAVGIPLTAWFMGAYGGRDVHEAQLFLMFALPGLFCVGLPSNSLIGLRRTVAFNVTRLVPTVIGVFAAGACAWEPTPERYLVAYAGFLVVCAGGMVCWSARGMKIGVGFEAGRNLLCYGIRGFPAGLMNVVSGRADMLVATALLSSHDLGLYAVASGLGQAVNGLLHGVGTVLMPLVASGGMAGTATLQRTFRVSAVMSVCGLAAVLAVLPWAMPFVFGDAFIGAVTAAGLLLGASVLAGLNWVLCDGFRGLGKPEWANGSEAAGLVVRGVGFAAVMVGPTLEGLAGVMLVSAAVSLGVSVVRAEANVGRWDFLMWLSHLSEDARRVWGRRG